jgi:hypothetical protein
MKDGFPVGVIDPVHLRNSSEVVGRLLVTEERLRAGEKDRSKRRALSPMPGDGYPPEAPADIVWAYV